MPTRARHDVVVLGYGPEPHLEECLGAAAAQTPQDSQLLLVDNGVANLTSRCEGWPAQVRVLGTGTNTGFAGGCNMAAASSTAEVLVFVNSDAVVTSGSVDQLVTAAMTPGAGLVCGSLRLADQPETVNSVGNPVHFTGITWAGHHGEPATSHDTPQSVASITGGFFAVRRAVWDRLGGFDPLYFAYHEDVDLSLRARLLCLRVDYQPAAVAHHHYEFSRSPVKMYLLERNRLITVLTDYPAPLLSAVLPALLVLEPVILALAATQGWWRQAIRARWWVLTHGRELRARRRRVQAGRLCSATSIAAVLSARLEPPMVAAPPGMGALNRCLEVYWRATIASLRHKRGR